MNAALRSPGTEYAALRESVSALVRSLGPHELSSPVDSCPGWTVHDVVSHLAGVASDVVDGVLPTTTLDDWTARQVAARSDTATTVVLREWERSSSQLEVLLDRGDDPLPTNLLDLAVHDDDIRAAVDRPRTDPSPVHDALPDAFAQRFLRGVDRAGLDPVRIVDPHGEVWAGASEAPVTFRAARAFLVRAAMGRRSLAQIERNLNGADDPSAYVELLCAFPPRDEDLTD